jgi:hypothetical protein
MPITKAENVHPTEKIITTNMVLKNALKKLSSTKFLAKTYAKKTT